MSAPAYTVQIRQPRPEDRDRISAIVESSGLFRPEEVTVALEVFDEAVEHPGLDYLALGAYDEKGMLVGFACYGPTPCTVGTWDLYWIAVDPARQRQGIGRALMEACERSMAGQKARLVVVQTSSRLDYQPTRSFYEKFGFVASARITDFYAPGDDLVIYTKRLESFAEI